MDISHEPVAGSAIPMPVGESNKDEGNSGDPVLVDTAASDASNSPIEAGPIGRSESEERASEQQHEDPQPAESSQGASSAVSRQILEEVRQMDNVSDPYAETGSGDEFFHNEAAQLSVDSQLSDNDSAIFDTSKSASSMSVRSSLYDFVEENGRTYHRYKDGQYVLPNDEIEQDRLDLQHQIYVMTLHGKLHMAPLENLKNGLHNVLDIGTGTGIWAIDFACTYPNATVTGTDLSPIQPEYVPPNCGFIIDDAEDEWTYSNKFDYIHGRALILCFKNMQRVVDQAFAHLNPGGYFELLDGYLPIQCIDSSFEGTKLQEWQSLVLEGSRRLGLDWSKSAKYRAFMERAGFVDVHEVVYAWPINDWPKGEHNKQLGRWVNQNLMSGVHAFGAAVLTRGLGISPEEHEVMLVDVRKDLSNRKIHVYEPIYCVYGRKPE